MVAVANDWNIKLEESVPRDEMTEKMRACHGLLLLSAPLARIPCKLFEYIAVRKPILVVTTRNSAVWRLAEGVPQMFCVDHEVGGDTAEINRFLEACASGIYDTAIPEEYAEPHLKSVFLNDIMEGVLSSASPLG